MNYTNRLSRVRLAPVLAMCGLVAAGFAFLTSAPPLLAQSANAKPFPQYDHVFLIVEENEDYGQVIGNPYAPIMNALAKDYGLATNYHGVADPSEPNYIAMLGGDFFGISSDDPYWFPGQTVKAQNLMSQLEGAGLTWRGYFQNMPIRAIAATAIRTNATAFPTRIRNMSRSTTAL